MTYEQFEADFIQEHEIRAQKISEQIFKILDDFVLSKKDILYINQPKNNRHNIVKTLLDKRWIISWLYFIITCIFYLIIFIELKFPILFINILAIFISALIIFIAGVYGVYKPWKSLSVSLKEARKKAVSRAKKYNLEPYYQIIEELGETFDEEYLHREEIRFKLIIEERKKALNQVTQATPLLSVLLIAVSFWILGTPDKINELNFLYGTVVGIPGIVFVTKVSLNLFFNNSSEDIAIYQKCVIILQSAQFIARKEQEDALQVYESAMELNEEVTPFSSIISEIEQSRQ
ncbi:MAG: hypothetical protein AAFQ80_12910 [Cyanobacteria bacterium J06621_8]